MDEGELQPVEPLRIIVDHRERSGQVFQFLERFDGIQLSFEQLKLGDYDVAGWLFERKTLTDFAASIIDGRLFGQALRLAASRASTAIILEGTGKDATTLGLHRNALQGAVISLALIYQIPILRSRCPEETAQVLIFAGGQLRREGSDGRQRHGRRPKRRRRLQLHVLQGLPGIGPHRATALLEHFGTVRGALVASHDELCQVHGINRVTAERIEWILGEGENQVGSDWTRHHSNRGKSPDP